MSLIKALSRQIPQEILERMIYAEPMTEADFKDQDKVNAWCNEMKSSLEALVDNGSFYDFSVEKDTERNIYHPRFSVRQHGIERFYNISYDFIRSSEFNAIQALNRAINGLLETGAYVQRGEKVKPVSTFEEALSWLMAESKRGQYIQRYKGLGEMNPSQLWETTMDPNTRRMLRVTIEDAIAADQLFTTLMGDHVEPRRNFIEDNALKVANLDI
jgi:DNA gyrase subunit B